MPLCCFWENSVFLLVRLGRSLAFTLADETDSTLRYGNDHYAHRHRILDWGALLSFFAPATRLTLPSPLVLEAAPACQLSRISHRLPH